MFIIAQKCFMSILITYVVNHSPPQDGVNFGKTRNHIAVGKGIPNKRVPHVQDYGYTGMLWLP